MHIGNIQVCHMISKEDAVEVLPGEGLTSIPYIHQGTRFFSLALILWLLCQEKLKCFWKQLCKNPYVSWNSAGWKGSQKIIKPNISWEKGARMRLSSILCNSSLKTSGDGVSFLWFYYAGVSCCVKSSKPRYHYRNMLECKLVIFLQSLPSLSFACVISV